MLPEAPECMAVLRQDVPHAEGSALPWEVYQQLPHRDPVRFPSQLITALLQSGKAIFSCIGQARKPKHVAGVGFALQSFRDNHQEQS